MLKKTEGVKMGMRDNKHGNDENVINFLDQSPFHRFMIESCEQAGKLSDTWLKLLGTAPTDTLEMGETVETPINIDSVAGTPSLLADDPWSVLTLGQGVEMVDLQHTRLADVHISLSEMEVEQALQIMQEQPTKNSNQT